MSFGSKAKKYLSEKVSRMLFHPLKGEMTSLDLNIFGHFVTFTINNSIPDNPSKLYFKESLKAYVENFFIPVYPLKLTYEEVLALFKELLPQGGIGSEEGDLEVAIIKAGLQLALDLDSRNEQALVLLNRFFPIKENGAFPKT